MTLICIDAPHFCAGVVVDERGTVVRAAPIVRYMIGWPAKRVTAYAGRKGWKAVYGNERLAAGKPMVFTCRQCLTPYTVPEDYVVKVELCPDCGGEWSR
jgi:hypothetical protein